MRNDEDADTKAKRYDHWFRGQVEPTLKLVREGRAVLLTPYQVRRNLRDRANHRKPGAS